MITRRFFILLLSTTLVAACGDDAVDETSQNQDVGELADVYEDAPEADAAGDADVGVDAQDGGDQDGGEGIVRDKALDDFVADDSNFEYELVWEKSGAAATTWLLDVTSQKWRTEDEVDRTTWRHDVTISVPNNADTSTALVLINGGDNSGSPPEKNDDDVTTMELVAGLVRTPVISISQIPNQPLTIYGEGEDMVEDDLVAHAPFPPRPSMSRAWRYARARRSRRSWLRWCPTSRHAPKSHNGPAPRRSTTARTRRLTLRRVARSGLPPQRSSRLQPSRWLGTASSSNPSTHRARPPRSTGASPAHADHRLQQPDGLLPATKAPRPASSSPRYIGSPSLSCWRRGRRRSARPSLSTVETASSCLL
ncbi:MAG: PhoPQ-activated protein PqaA family protein [Persicimonas sp.]